MIAPPSRTGQHRVATPPVRATPRAYVTLSDRSFPLGRWYTSAILAALLLLVGCTPPPPAQRPREGARPQVQVEGTPLRLEAIPPATLSIAGGLIPTPTWTPTPDVPPTLPPPSPSPGRGAIAAASPGASPGIAPIVSGLQPAPNSTLPAGDVVISARVSATSDLVDVAAFVDGEAIPLDLGNGTVRVKTVSFVRTFISGSHEVRIQARDDRGQLGGYRWSFNVGAPRQVAPAPPRLPTATPAVPSFTPPPIPTRRPTAASAPPPTAPAPPPPTATRFVVR
jgi:hypothetical protein